MERAARELQENFSSLGLFGSYPVFRGLMVSSVIEGYYKNVLSLVTGYFVLLWFENNDIIENVLCRHVCALMMIVAKRWILV